MIVVGFKTRRVTDSTVNIENEGAIATHQMMVIVTDAILETSGRTRRLNATNESLISKRTERVVDGLARDRSNLVSHRFGELFRRGMGRGADGFKNRQALRGDLQSTTSQLVFEALGLRRAGHGEHSSKDSGHSQEFDRV